MKFILGTKEKMTQVFDKEGLVYPVTVIQAGPVVVTQIKNEEKDTYSAVQVAFGEKKEKNINKPLKGHFKDLGNFRYSKEFRLGKDAGEYKVGDKIDLSIFEIGDEVTVSSISKGKGFQGVVKRHGFHGGRRSHGQKHSEREPGSIGATGPQRVFKGTKMGGRMGSDRVTIKGLKIAQIDKESNQILVKGAIAGRKGTLVEIVG
jgi:large subunit ribosomal protein L3